MTPTELGQQVLDFLSRYRAADAAEREALKTEAAALAERLRTQAMDLSMVRATEFSPDIPRYVLLAAEIALLAYGPDAPELRPYEEAIHYYRDYPATQALVEAYERYRELVTGRKRDMP